MNKRVIILLVSVAILLSSRAYSQVRPVQSGHALDANYRVGSGGYNNATGAYHLPNSQLYVTGQVTGLGAFQGSTGYYSPSQLSLTLPNKTLSRFNRQSVNLKQILSGPTYIATPYHNPLQSVLTGRDISSGRAVPGMTIPRPVHSAGNLGKQLYIDARKQYNALSANPQTAISARKNADIQAIGANPEMPESRLNIPAFRTDITAPFNISRHSERNKLIRDLNPPKKQNAPLDVRFDNSKETFVDAEKNRPRNQNTLGKSTEKIMTGLPERNIPTSEKTITSAILPDKDVFLDVLVHLHNKKISKDEPGGRKIPQPEDSLPKTPSAPSIEKDASKPIPGKIVELKEGGQIILHSLAGKRRDAYNLLLADAEELLKNGKFYSAANEYELAASYDPTNPLPREGVAVSYFIAGEPLTAGRNMIAALKIFPPLMETRLNVSAMTGEKVFAASLDALDKKLSELGNSAEPALLLLAAMMHRNNWDDQAAKKYATLLQESNQTDKLLKAYAAYIITGKLPERKDTEK